MKVPKRNVKQQLKLLVADNHPVVHYGLSAMFANSNEIDVVGQVKDGKELLEVLNEKKPNILLLELNQVGVDIYRLLKQILVAHPSLRIVAFTSYNYFELMESIIELGIHGFLLKSASKEQITKAINSVVQGKKFLDERVQLTSNESSNLEVVMNAHKNGFVLNKFKLTSRERDVLILLTRGMSSKQVAASLHISGHTVESHKKNMLKKLKLKTLIDLIRFAIKNGYE
jgi:DNA-binding NarL/FixJ family response regulator